jgi:FlaA1/EpsC-like NDP-sugar epimerase
MGSSHSSETLYDSYVESKFDDLTGKVVAITGTTSGSIGYHLAKAAVAKNAKCVILLNRQSDRSVKSEEGEFNIWRNYKC